MIAGVAPKVAGQGLRRVVRKTLPHCELMRLWPKCEMPRLFAVRSLSGNKQRLNRLAAGKLDWEHALYLKYRKSGGCWPFNIGISWPVAPTK